MRLKTMTLRAEFMRRFLLHVLPSGFHRIRHFGLLANGGRRENLAKVRALLLVVGAKGDVGISGDRDHHTRPTDVRLPSVRGGHGHRRGLWARATDPRTTLVAGDFMNSTRPILSTTVHWLAPMRHRFAFQGESLGFCRVHHPKTLAIPAGNSMPSRKLPIGPAGKSRLVSPQKLKSP